MTFFEHQQAARRNTRVLVLLYLAAVVGVIIAVDLVLAAAWLWMGSEIDLQGAGVPRQLFVWGAIGTVAVIFGASLFHILKLSEGGDAVARLVGARQVATGTTDLLERRLLNVVEEMAIASGVRVPKVYVMDEEQGINAFAAGWNVSRTVVAVTRGTLETLNRDELQGVIGHEFSHILNDDIRLNIRMLGVLGGIVFIGSVGSFIMRSVGRSSGSKKDGAAGLFFLGLALFIVGYAGFFFARLIKSAVSRQREFLADASSVQFTRNPDSIAGALDQIRVSTRGTLIANRYAEDLSHMFFGQGVPVWIEGLFATHPPIEERIRRVHPRFQPGGYRSRRPAVADPTPEQVQEPAQPEAAVAFGGAATQQDAGQRLGDVRHAWGRSAGESAAMVGTLDGGKLDFARRLLAALPEDLRERVGHPDGACAAILALLLAAKDSVLDQQLAAVREGGAADLAEAARGMAPALRPLGLAYHLPVIDLALPAVKSAPADLQRQLLAELEAAVHADRRVSLHEFVVLTLVRAQLAPATKPARPRFRAITEVREEARLLLTLIAVAGIRPGPEGEKAFQLAFQAGAEEMGIAGSTPLPRDSLSLDSAAAALANLKGLGPAPMATFIKGMFAAASADGTLRVIEAELLRLAGAVLNCPLPPLLEDLDPAALAA